ncbi:MAG TPA: PfkB family carbohydrate kinase [Candidatus Thalassarchaeaceae archaeon]|nr:PfkB family carbohydrate kinase [Candidatus Thalassarchaeaceae archaeon]
MDEAVLIVGSLAYDSVSSPAGSVENELGGSATYGGLAAAFHRRRLGTGTVGIVGVVGDDFSEEDRQLLKDADLDLSGLETVEGGTFRWSGSYHGSMAEAETHETHLNVFEHFQPRVPEHSKSPTITFCANLHPIIQSDVLDQAPPSRLSMLDSMNLWIQIALDDLLTVMKRVDLTIINDGEVRMLADDDNLVRAAHSVRSMIGSTYLIVKRGEHGVLALHPDGAISIPAFPVADVVDPTGCGDTFAGTIAAHLAKGTGPIELNELRAALEAATVTASFTLEAFGTSSLANLDESTFNKRLSEFHTIIHG